MLGLRFLGFEFRDMETAKRFRSADPAAEMTSLVAWHRFEERNPDTFAAMYQFWSRKE